jgi:hypothetical protein
MPSPDSQCATNICTCCSGDGFDGIFLPGEFEQHSPADLVRRLLAEGTSTFCAGQRVGTYRSIYTDI